VIAALSPTDRRALIAAWRTAWLPRPRPVRSAWCAEHIRLPDQVSAQPGPFSFDGREYQPAMLDVIDDPAIREVVIIAAPQVGKTELERAMICSQGEVDRAPMMFAGPDQPYAREQRDNVYAIAEATPALRRRIPPTWRRNDRAIDLQTCLVWLAWSGSTQRLSGRSCKIVLCSEVDRWANDPHLAKKRTAAFWRSCVVYEGSPDRREPLPGPALQGLGSADLALPVPPLRHVPAPAIFPLQRRSRRPAGVASAGCGATPATGSLPTRPAAVPTTSAATDAGSTSGTNAR